MLSDKAGRPLELILYKSDTCWFCHKVMDRINQLQLQIESRDVGREPGVRDELIAFGGKGQVPCLSINGQALYESDDIVQFLENEIALA